MHARARSTVQRELSLSPLAVPCDMSNALHRTELVDIQSTSPLRTSRPRSRLYCHLRVRACICDRIQRAELLATRSHALARAAHLRSGLSSSPAVATMRRARHTCQARSANHTVCSTKSHGMQQCSHFASSSLCTYAAPQVHQAQCSMHANPNVLRQRTAQAARRNSFPQRKQVSPRRRQSKETRSPECEAMISRWQAAVSRTRRGPQQAGVRAPCRDAKTADANLQVLRLTRSTPTLAAMCSAPRATIRVALAADRRAQPCRSPHHRGSRAPFAEGARFDHSSRIER